MDFAVIKSLYVHLSDINESHNYHNGSPSDVLAVIPIENKSFGDIVTVRFGGWSGGAMVLGKLPVPGRPTIWITVGQEPTALTVGVGGGCLDIFILIYLFSPLSPSLWETARYRLKYCLKGPLNPKQPTNQPTTVRFEHPEFKRLKNGAITELKLVVKDEKNNVVDNHGLPMSCVLEIISFSIFSFIIMSIFGVKRGRVVDEDILSNATLNMDGKRIINVAYPRNPVENSAYNGDVVTAKALSDFRKYLLDEVLLRNSDNVMDGRLEMSGHKIKGLGNPVDSGDAVNKEYITARLKAVTDELNSMLERINKLEKNKT